MQIIFLPRSLSSLSFILNLHICEYCTVDHPDLFVENSFINRTEHIWKIISDISLFGVASFILFFFNINVREFYKSLI